MKQTPEDSFKALKNEAQTISLSTLSEQGKPNASYAPFVMGDDGNLYIFVSGLASHTQDLLANPVASVLLMRDEQDTRQIFARQRASYQCDVEVVSENETEYTLMLDKLEARFGNVVELLRGLPDFILFRLRPYKGQFVMGFGKAYTLTGEGLLELQHINPAKG
jgi:putative heme iron utilization protein